ncbi:MAG: peptide deformylase [Candidatus Omnitrophota bacterium]|nr:MAG: peptide deformylase [Candidatus Omnitrophota bacterium]
MKPLEIVKYPDIQLRNRCKELVEVTKKHLNIFKQMLFTMRNFSGIGLAAPQVGVFERLIVADIGKGQVISLANPKIISLSENIDSMVEGCLSVENISVKIKRPLNVIVKGLNEKGKMVEIKAEGLTARVLQHEIDHLNGKLIIDYLSLLDKLRLNVRKGL